MNRMPDFNRRRADFVREWVCHAAQLGAKFFVRDTRNENLAIVIVDVRDREGVQRLAEFKPFGCWNWTDTNRGMICT